MHVQVTVTLRTSILDPQGKAVEHGIHSMGFTSVGNVRIGKIVDLDIDTTDGKEALRVAEEIAKKLLANPVMEDFTVTLVRNGEHRK
ncbi:MAG: phosphoribosylformylglycinamidine synthase subunit PurS [Bacteroidetes bacterium]|jgi:phosphoribosylformylglycinamidine synthase|nr:phosphoribosylformylglycinamidine synthase subunit PurS [Bacteroidota bacterium]